MPFPHRLLADDEDVLRHLHPHWLTLAGPVLRLLLVIGATSFAAALVPAGRHQGVLRLLVLALAVLLLLISVGGPLLRWWTTHYVITTSRLLVREGMLARSGRDLDLARITDVSFRQSLWERLVDSGNLTVGSAGDGAGVVLRRVQDPDGTAQVLREAMADDAERRAHDGGYLPSVPAGSWGTEPVR